MTRISPVPSHISPFRNKAGFYGEELSEPLPSLKLEEHPLSAVRGCLFNVIAATFHIGGRSSIHNLRTLHAVVTGTHLSLSLTNNPLQKNCRNYIRACERYITRVHPWIPLITFNISAIWGTRAETFQISAFWGVTPRTLLPFQRKLVFHHIYIRGAFKL